MLVNHGRAVHEIGMTEVQALSLASMSMWEGASCRNSDLQVWLLRRFDEIASKPIHAAGLGGAYTIDQ